MIDRCYNPNNAWYHRYGGRGIVVCERWLGPHGFQNFLADMGEKPHGMSIDRFPDNDGPYTPNNCRWATAQEQTANRKTTRLTITDARQIRSRHAKGESQAAIAKHFAIAPCHVSQIVSGARWKDPDVAT